MNQQTVNPHGGPEGRPSPEALMEKFWPQRRGRGVLYMPDFSIIPDRPLRMIGYPFNFTLAAQATFQQTIVIAYRFYWWGITGNSSLNLQGLGLPYRVRISDGRTRQPFQSGSIINTSLVGSGQLPFFIRRPHCVPSRRPLNVQVENSATVQNVVQVVLWGAIYEG